MKKLVAIGVAVLAAGVLAIGAGASGDGGTVVASGFSCAILDGNGNSFITTNSTLTVFGSKSVLRCSGVGDAGAGPWPIYWNFGNTGLSCAMLQFGSTTNWQDKVGYNGLSQLVCYGPPTPPTAPASSGAGVG